jgi:hypothetical protein
MATLNKLTRGNAEIGRGFALAQRNEGWDWLAGKPVKIPLVQNVPLDFNYQEAHDANPGTANRLLLTQYHQFKSLQGTQLFKPHPSQQRVLDDLATYPIIWLRPGQGFGKSVFCSWVAAKAIKREGILLSSGKTWLPPMGKILIGTKSRAAQADNIDGFITKFIPESIILNPSKNPNSPYRIKDGAISSAKFSTGTELVTRSYDASVQAWMNLTVALCVLDELPPDPRIIEEVVTRISRIGGTLLIAASEVYEETAGSADMLREFSKTGLVKIVEGDARENPYLSKSGMESLNTLFNDDQRNIRMKGLGSFSPLKMFPYYSQHHRLESLDIPYNLTLDTARFICGIDQGSPASPWAFALIAYWTPADHPNHPHLFSDPLKPKCFCLVLEDFTGPNTNAGIITRIKDLISAYQHLPSFPKTPERLIAVGDPALREVSASDGISSFQAISEHLAISTPDKPKLLSSFNFINDLFKDNLIFLAPNAHATHLNLYSLARKTISPQNLPKAKLLKDPLDAIRYPIHFIHASHSHSLPSSSPHLPKFLPAQPSHLFRKRFLS